MNDKLKTLKEAIDAGKVIKIKYDSGLQPGAVREIIPKEIVGNKLKALCLTSNKVLTFFLYRIEIASESDKVDFTGYENSNTFSEPSKNLINILQEAIGTGEVIKIKYFGGSQPGTVREIMPRKIDNDKDMIYAYCLVSDRVLSLSLPKIEIASESDAVNYTFVDKYIDFQNVPMWIQTLKELKDNYKGDLEKLGWFVKTGEKSIELSASGKERIMPDICIYFEEEYGRERPWIVKCRGIKTTSFEHEHSAVEKFLKHCSKYKPEQKDEPKQPQPQPQPQQTNEPQPLQTDKPKLYQPLNLVENHQENKSGCGLYCLLLLLSCIIFLGNVLF